MLAVLLVILSSDSSLPCPEAFSGLIFSETIAEGKNIKNKRVHLNVINLHKSSIIKINNY